MSFEGALVGSSEAPVAVSITEDGVNGRNALSDPLHDGNRHRVAERLVTGAIGCRFAAVLDQGVVIGKTLQTLALTRGQSPHGHLRRHHSIDPAALAATLEGPRYIGRGSKFSRPGNGLLLEHSGR